MVGLAVGFGSQTLVKDIITGLFTVPFGPMLGSSPKSGRGGQRSITARISAATRSVCLRRPCPRSPS
ncbi:hypothetical protein QSG27_26725 [Azospirillum sp. C340-1]|uniref:Uncharacterized protein n=1 Tax=Azospirillum isscasi TaxID=3053926 RepID=A0ABU0WQ15_9PROT|nr:hypothetical protein [Azospirillum isscasi]